MKKLFIALASLAAISSAQSVMADVVYVTARPQGCTVSTNCPGPNTVGYLEVGFTTGIGDFGAAGTAAGRPVTPTVPRGYIGSGEITDPETGVNLYPVLGVPGGTYRIDYNFSSTAGNTSTNVVMSAMAFNADLSFTETDKFQRSFGNPANRWNTIGYLTNHPGSSTPAIFLRYQSGMVSGGNQNRWIFDCWRFTLVEPCLDVPVVTAVGPVSTNSNQVVVAGVTNTATAVTVYQDTGSGMVAIGTKTTGVTGGNNTVTVSGLMKNAKIAATQTINGQEGCTPPAGFGAVVGGGANPRVRIALSIREATSTGPIGTTGTGPANIHFLGSSTRVGSSPGQGIVVQPSTNWQTVTLQRGVDRTVKWNSASGDPVGTVDALPGDWGVLDSINFTIDDLTDTGPYVIYIDDLQNGSTVFQNWEAAEVGAANYAFWNPGFSGTTSGNILAQPNESVVTDVTAAAGTKSLRASFQWSGTENSRWLRFTTAGVPAGVSNPQVNLNEPISFKILLLPVGATPPAPPVSTPPVLNFTKNGNQINFSWTGSFVLQETSALGTSWSDVQGAGPNSHSVSTASGTKFYRLRN